MSSDETNISYLEEEILIRVGHAQDSHIISWDTLKTVGSALQSLILTLTKYSSEFDKGPLDLKDFKLSFSGFYDGSAIPAFKITSSPNLFYEDLAATKTRVASEFEHVMRNIHQKNYSNIAERYREPSVYNEVLKGAYHFTRSAGKKPLAIVQRSNGGFENVYKIHRIEKKTFDLLLKPADTSEEIEESTAVAEMVISKDKEGNISRKRSEVYEDRQAVPSLKLDRISYLGRDYSLYSPILFQLYKEDGGYTIENDQLDIYASGLTVTDAKINLYSKFDDSYQRLNELKDEQLGKKLLRAKQYMNTLVKSLNVK